MGLNSQTQIHISIRECLPNTHFIGCKGLGMRALFQGCTDLRREWFSQPSLVLMSDPDLMYFTDAFGLEGTAKII